MTWRARARRAWRLPAWGTRATAAALLVTAAGCAAPAMSTAATHAVDEARIVVAVRDVPDVAASIGGTPRADYAGRAGYAGSDRAAALAEQVAADHGLALQAAWTIVPLQLRCMVYRLAPGADRDAALARIGADARVELVQPFNRFETYASPASPTASATSAASPAYDDPYVGLQRGFAAIDAADAQHWTQGDGVRIALIDTGLDATHPELNGRIAERRDFARGEPPADTAGERHGTQVAGVMVAAAHNGMGIVGIAPQARLLVYRACWAMAAPGGAARCDTYTLAQALAAAITAGADVINLSLGGPSDPLLQRLVERANAAGAVVVGAVPPGGRMDGFPAGVPGVLAVTSSDDPAPAGPALSAPGRDILTLAPGGHYDYASGSSLATAHVSGAVALLRSLQPGLSGAAAWQLLANGAAAGRTAPIPVSIDVCAAVRRLRPTASCGAPLP